MMVSIALQATELFSIASTIVVGILWAILRYIQARYFKVKAHAADDDDSEGNLLTALVEVIAAPFNIANRNDLAKFSKDINDISRASDNSAKFIAGMLQYTPIWVRTSIGRQMPANGWLFAIEDLNPKQFLTDARTMLTDSNISLSYTNEDVATRLKALYDTRIEIAKRLIGFKTDPNFSRDFNEVARRLDLWKQKHFVKQTRVRPVPFNVTFFGKPSSGKTYATAMLAQRLGLSLWTHKSKFWDGYAGQPIVLYDDWCATDVTAEFVQEWMTIHSNVAFYPEFASLNDPSVGVKGTPFSSHYVFCSTNTAYPAPNVVHDKIAFLRRRSALVNVVKNVDNEGVEHRTYQFFNPLANEAISEPLTFDEFYQEFLAQVTTHFTAQRTVMDDLDKPLEGGDDPFQQIFAQGTENPSMRLAEPRPFDDDPLQDQHRPPPPVIVSPAEVAKFLPSTSAPQPRPVPLYQPQRVPSCVPPALVPIVAAEEEAPWYKKTWDWWKTANTTVAAFLHHYPWIIPTLGVIAAGYVIYRLLLKPKLHPHSAYEAGETPKGGRMVRRTPIAPQGLEAQDDSDFPTNIKTIQSCQVSLRLSAFYNSKPWNMRGYGIGTSSCILMPSHFLAPLRTGVVDKLHLEYTRTFKSGDNVQRSIDITSADVSYMLDQGYENDISSVNIGTSSCFPNIIKYFLDDFTNSSQALLLGIGSVPSTEVHAVLSDADVEYEYNGLQVVTNCMYKYAGRTQVGDCGRMLVRFDGANTYRILGMHTAGSSSAGYSVPILRSDVRQIAAGIVMPPIQPVPVISPPLLQEVCAQGNGDEIFPGQLTLLEDSVLKLHAPTKHAHRPSVLAPFLEPSVKDNSVLSPHDPRAPGAMHPMHLAISKISKPGDNYDESVLDQAYQLLKGLFPFDRTPRVLSTAEAIYGTPGWIRSLNFASSAGFPYNLKKKKRDLFFDSIGAPRVDNSVLATCDFREHFAMKNVRIPSVWTSVLKDELRMVGKVTAGLTRSICAAPVDYTIVFRRYFQDCIQLIEESRDGSPSIVGIDINSIEFDKLIKRVNTHPNIYATDYRNNDGSFPVAIMDRVLRFFNEAYDDEYSTIRDVLYHEAMYTYHYWDHYVFLDHGSENSGFAGTTINNTLGDLLEDIYCILKQAPSDVKVDLAYLKKHFVLVRYGDDSLTSYSDEVSPWFSPQKHIAQVNENGREMTSEDKLTETTLKEITDVTILKQRPGYSPDFPGRFVPLMEKQLIEDIPKWIRRGGDAYINTVVNCDCALRFALWHGEEYYEMLRHTYEDAFKKYGEPHTFTSYQVALRARQCEYYGFQAEFTDYSLQDLSADLRDVFDAPCDLELTNRSLRWFVTTSASYLLHLHVYNTTVERILTESAPKVAECSEELGIKMPSASLPQIFLVKRSRLGILPGSVTPAYLPRMDMWAMIYDPTNPASTSTDDSMILSQGQSYIFPAHAKIKVEGPVYPEYPSLVLQDSDCKIPDCYTRLKHLTCRWYSCAEIAPTICRVSLDSDVPAKVIKPQGDDGSEPVNLDLVQIPSEPNQTHRTADAQWDLHKFFGREYHVITVPWNLNSEGNVFALEMPYALAVTAQQRAALYAFHHIRADIHIRVVVSGTRFHQGIAVASFDYGARNSVIMYALPHAIMSANGVSEATLHFPFIWPRMFLSVNPKESYAFFKFNVLSPLLATEGSTKSVQVSVYASFGDIKTQLPLIRLTAQGNSSSVYNISQVEGNGNQLSNSDEVDQRNTVSPSFAVSAGKTAGSASATPSPPMPDQSKVTDGSRDKDKVIATKSKPVESTAAAPTGAASSKPKAASSVAAPLQARAVTRSVGPVLAPTTDAGGEGGLDLVANHIDPPYVQTVKYGNFYNAENIEPVYVARMYPNQLTKTSLHDTGHDYDEMMVENLVTLPHQIDKISFSDQAYQTLLATYNVEPTFYKLINIADKYSYVPWCQAIASLSAFWSGDMIFTFQVSSSGYQTGKLLVSVVYGLDQPLSYSEALNGHTTEIDVSNPHLKHAIRVPFIDLMPTLPVSLGAKDTRRTWVAKLYVYVQSPLSTPSGAPPRVDLLVNAAGASNLQFVGRAAEVPYTYAGPFTVPAQHTITLDGFIFPQGDNEEAVNAPYTLQLLSASSIPITPSDITFDVQDILGERFVTLKDYFKSRPVTANFNVANRTPYDLFKMVPGSGLLECFLLRRGGFRFSLKSLGPDRAGVLFYFDNKSSPVCQAHLNYLLSAPPGPTDIIPVASRAFGIILDNTDGAITFETPHVGPTRTVYTKSAGGWLYIASKDAKTSSFTLYAGLADETRFFHLLCSPSMVLTPYKTIDGKTIMPAGW
jgi:hypothetical protein